ncbi:MAG: FAD-dependent oxidoreductase [Acidobacteria bacterium]|nr:FAD-dependent oxidoreductase [Acidobacteriota bacterium]
MSLHARLPDLEHWKAQVKCQTGCPVQTDAGRYVQLIANGQDKEAFLVARAPNPFASVCGRVCAAPCEDACRRGAIDSPVSIRALKRYVTEQYGAESVKPDTQDELRPGGVHDGNRYVDQLPLGSQIKSAGQAPRRKVAVIGAGPAGMAAAHDLALLGHEVTVFEAGSEPGGMMRYGIPEYRLSRSLLRAEIDKILALGVTLKLNTPLTPAFGLPDLRAEGFESVFLSVGVSRGRDLQIPGVELDGVVKAVDYLLNINRGFRMDLGQRVVVIGGGFVAFDAARTALRVGREDELDALEGAADARAKEAFDSARAALRGGAAEVTMVSLEHFDEMPVLRTMQGHDEYEEAQKEGVTFLTRRGPRTFLGAHGRLTAIALRAVQSVFDESGRFAPVYDENDVITVEADACILAIGQQPDLSFLTPADGIDLHPAGTIRVDPATLATSATGVFSGGDVAFGPRNLIQAVANGKLAARSIHRFLTDHRARIETRLEVEAIPTATYRMATGFEKADRVAAPTLDIGRRTGIAEVETGYGRDAAVEQAERCLVCHVQTIYDPELCVLCNRCVDICPEYCLAFVPFEDVAMPDGEREAAQGRVGDTSLPLTAMVKDDERCIRCGLCAIRCPTGAMTMEKFSITEAWAEES